MGGISPNRKVDPRHLKPGVFCPVFPPQIRLAHTKTQKQETGVRAADRFSAMIKYDTGASQRPKTTPFLRTLRGFWPWAARLLPKSDAHLDVTDVSDLDDKLRRDIGLPPKETRQRPYPQTFKPPPFF